MADRELKVVITGDSSSLNRALKDTDKSTKKFGFSLGSMAKTAGLAAGAAGIGAVVVGLKSSIDAAKEAEVAQAQLEQALDSAGLSFAKHGDAIDTAIQKTSRLAAVDDEELSASFSKLVRTTGDVQKSIEGMNLATDIARARNISLEAATKFVEKALNGQETAFTRIGIKVKDNQDATDALTLAQERFGGAAEKYGQTAAGAQENLGVAFENLQETIGAKLLPVFTKLIVKLNEVVIWVQDNWPRIQDEFQAGMDKAKAIFELIKPFLKVIIDQVEALVRFVKAIIEGDWSEAWKQLKEIVVNGLRLAWEYVKLWKNTIGTALLELAKFAADKFKEGLAALPGVMLAALKALPGLIIDIYAAMGKAAYGIGKAVVTGLASGLKDVGLAIGGAIGSGVKSALNSVFDQINAALEFKIPIPFGPDINVNPPNIPHLAKGGIVRSPTLAVIGESGPEAVVPLGRGGGGTMVFNFPNYVGDKRDLERSMQQIMRRFEDSNGISFTGRSL